MDSREAGEFSSKYMGQSISVWSNISNIAEKTLSRFFDGSDDSLNRLKT